MPIVFDAGVDEVEDPTLLGPTVLTKGQGAEYRKGKRGIHRAKGRALRGSVASATWKGIYYAGFDGGDGAQFLIAHSGNTLYQDTIGDAMVPTSMKTLETETVPVVGAHYANRHYLATGSENLCVELINGITQRQMGMAKTDLTVGVSLTQGAGDITTTTGFTYWLTEYDSTRGIESIAGSTAHTGAFTALDSVVLTVGGTHSNTNSNRIRAYRSVDGGVFPDGGMIQEVPRASTTITDTDSIVNTLPSPLYGFVTIAGVDFDRDTKPDELRCISGPFNNSMLGFLMSDLRAVAFSADGRPESWPAGYRIPLQTHVQDTGMCLVELNGMYGVFTKDTVHRLTRLPREIDTAFAAGEALSLVTDERGSVSRKAAVAFTLPGRGSLIMFAARDGIWATDLIKTWPLTDGVDWEGRVDGAKLGELELVNNSNDRRVICYYRKINGGHGVMHLDYMTQGIRITHPDHGAIGPATEAPFKGFLRVFTGDARTANGQIYTEGVQDADDSNFTTSDGRIAFTLKSAEIFPTGNVLAKRRMGRANWRHDATSDTVIQRLFTNREAHAEPRVLDFTKREATTGGMEKEVNSFSLQLESTGTTSFGIHWVEVEGFESARLSGGGA